MTLFPIYSTPVTRFSGHSSTSSSSKSSRQSPTAYQDNDILILYGAPIQKITYAPAETPEKSGHGKRLIPYPPLPKARTSSSAEPVSSGSPEEASATLSTEPLVFQPKRPEMQEIKRNSLFSPFKVSGENLWIGGAPIPRVKPQPQSKHVHFQLDEPETDSLSENAPRATQFHWSRFQKTDSESEQSEKPTRFFELLGAHIPERKR